MPDLNLVKAKLKEQRLETPSWGYGDSGTRFQVFHQRGAARNVYQKIDDAAQVHKFTGVTPSVALHIPWDRVDDWSQLRDYAKERGLTIGAINPNLFQADEYSSLASLAHEDERIRQQAIAHMLECVDIMDEVGSNYLSLWLSDGTNYPGQGDFRRRKALIEDGLKRVYERMGNHMTLLIEYKFFEPAFYHTDIADWGMATMIGQKIGERAKTLVDLGHHPLGTNIEHIVAFLIDEERLGGFHFNSKKYADDDLTTGSINPYELFLIFKELVTGEQDKGLEIAYMIDQSHNVKPKIEAMIQSVVNIQEAYAKALLVDLAALREAQLRGDVVSAEEILLDAYRQDVRPLLEEIRQELGVPPRPLEAFRKSGYQEKIAQERG